ncbi:MAG: tetratricopeptide repeat protein [Armatimonadota bacterium]|nr:tetratricopeptide repeat protein [Armatimonadota bacterium]
MAKPSSAPSRLRQPEWLRQFGRRLKAARARVGLTQQQLAAPDLSKSFISLLESARSYPSVETVIALAKRTHTSLASLLMDPTDLRLETALNLLHLAWTMDPARHSADALHLVGTAEILLPDMPAELRVRSMLVRSRVAMATGHVHDAARMADEAVALARRLRLDGALCRALTLKGVVLGRRGEFQAAIETLDEALRLMRRTRSANSEEAVWALLSTGAAQRQTGQVEGAQASYQRALELATSLGLAKMRGRALTGLGMVAWSRQHLDLAVDVFSQAYRVFEELEDLAEMGRVLNNLGLVRRAQGLYDEALLVLNAALRLREREGDIRGRSSTLDELAQVLLALGRADEAAGAARQAVADAEAVGDQARRAVAQVTLARALRAQRHQAQAADLLREAVATLTRLNMTPEAASASAELGLLLKETGQREEAADYLARALTFTASHAPAPPGDLAKDLDPPDGT